MNISTDAKVGFGVIIATLIIIGVGAFVATKNQPTAQNTPTQVASNPDRLLSEGAPQQGSDTPTVTVVEFGDFQCPACGALHKPLKEAQELLKDQPVQFVFRQFPLQQHEFADLAAQASLEAHAQGKFWEYHDLLFENQLKLTREDLETYAQQAELNLDQFKTALDSNTYAPAVQADLADGRAVGVNSTPTLYINGTRYQGPFVSTSLVEAISQAGTTEPPSDN